MKNLIGNTINQYQILLKIRESGTRILYKAYDTKTLRYVALEVVKLPTVNPSELLELLNDQSRKNARLIHSNIALVIDSGIDEDLIFLVYNFCPLHPLRRLLNRTYSWKELSRELVAITQALSHAHAQGIFHGFLNPASIILDEAKNPILFDFGFEQIVINYITAHFPGSWINQWGFEYCSPEQLKGSNIDWRSDVYAMGMILYEWLTGEIALLDESALTTLRKRSSSAKPEVNLNKNASSVIQMLLEKCLALDPVDRYQTMQELSILLAHSALDLTLTEKMVERPLSIPALKSRSRRWPMVVAVVCLLALTTGFIVWDRITSPFQSQDTRHTPVVFNTSSVPTVSPASPTSPPSTAEPAATEAQEISPVSYPLFQETPLAPLNQNINAANADQLIMIGLWGMGDANHLAVSESGTQIAAASSIGVFIYSVDDLKLQKHLDTRAWMSTVAFSPDGQILAAGDRDGLIRLWDTRSWEEIGSYSGHRMEILELAFSPDGTRFASVASDETLIQWEINAADDLKPVLIPVETVTSVLYSTDGNFIITGGDDFKINIWDAANLSLQKTITLSSKVVDIATLNGSGDLAVGGSDRRITVVDTETSERINQLQGLRFALSDITSSSNSDMIAAGDTNGGIVSWDQNGQVLWRVSGEEETISGSDALAGSHSVGFSADGKSLISVSGSGTFRVFDAMTGEEKLRSQSLDVHAQKLAISYDSKYLISEHGNRNLKVWDLSRGEILYEIPGQILAGNPFSTNNQFFAIAADASTVKVYGLSGSAELYTFNGNSGMKTIQFANNSIHLAAGHEQAMHLWSMTSGQELKMEKKFSGTGCTIYSDFNENPLLYITKYNRIVSIDSPLCSFQIPEWMKTFHIDEFAGRVAYGGSSKLAITTGGQSLEMNGVNRQNIIKVTIHPTGNLLAAAFDDNTIHIWDVATQQEVMSLFGHGNTITDLKFTPDGKLLLSASLDGTIRLWGIPN